MYCKTLRAEILQFFRVIFGSNENFKICFRDLLTFTLLAHFLCSMSKKKVVSNPQSLLIGQSNVRYFLCII